MAQYDGEYLAYILSGTDLSVRHVLRFERYEFNEDIDFANTSTILVREKPNLENDDFVICKKGDEVLYIGVCKDAATSEDSGYTISMKAKECLFDRPIFIDSESLISETGIEDFIVKAIRDNWVDSGDSLMDKSYIQIQAATHTIIYSTVASIGSTEDGKTYNLKTFLGNAMEFYHVFLDFAFSNGELDITVRTEDVDAVELNTGVSDVVDYEETYKVDVLAKLNVLWKIPDQEVGGVTTIGAETNRTYYLLNNRELTTDQDDARRVMGTAKSVYIETAEEADMIQQAKNEFTSNRYEHKISFGLNKQSKAYPASYFYVGRPGRILTKAGMKTTIITARTISSENAAILLTFGKLKVTLIEKMRGL